MTAPMTALTVLNERVDAVERRLDSVEGELLEIKFHLDMPSWVRHYLKQPSLMFVDDIPGLEDAVAEGLLTEADVDHLAALDSIVRGMDRASGDESYLAVELSHTVNAEDVERADERARLLARIGLRARPFVAGYRITQAAESMTDDRGVLVSLRRQPA